ncbi:MAG: 2-oxo acid dehydrogenase subunit E2 [Bacteroidetes bacterium]|nr:2-oxo acid dehydrogenase subunit E2 [Bacteroidota bacterium]
MAEVIKMPKMSDTMTEGVIVSWLKKVGDQVKSGDILAEIETDKATMELESYDDGELLYIGAKEKDKVAVGAVLAIIGKKGEDINSLIKGSSNNSTDENRKETTSSENKSASTPTEQEEKLESENNQESNNTTENQTNSDKTQSNKETDNQPTINNENSNISNEQVGQIINNDRIKASPLAKRVAKEMGYDITKIQGTGENGRIIKRDVESHDQSDQNIKNQEITSPTQNQTINYPILEESYEEVTVSSMRATIGKKLTESLANAPHFYVTQEIDMSKVVQMREIINCDSDISINISFNDIILKAVSIALRRYPEVNVSWLGDKIRKNHHIHIGVAVALKDGLVVPVLRFVDSKSLSQISTEVKDFIIKANENKLMLNDIQGSTFCVSNLGMFGIDSFTSIINPPSACILAVGGIKKKPVIDENGGLGIGDVMKVTLSCDHRAVDGALGAKFLKILKSILEEPISMLY